MEMVEDIGGMYMNPLRVSYKDEISIKTACTGTVIVEYDGKTYHLPPWIGGPSLPHEWGIIEAMLVSRKLTYTYNGHRIGWLGDRKSVV